MARHAPSVKDAIDKTWPRTVAGAVKILIKGMDSKSINAISTATNKDEFLAQQHLFMGMGIRNKFGLWGGNKALRLSCGKRHPDDCSHVILSALWEKLHGEVK